MKKMIIWCVFIVKLPFSNSFDVVRTRPYMLCFNFFPSLPFALLFFVLLFGMLFFFSEIKKIDTILSVSYYRSEEREFENFMRAFFGQFQPDRERFQGTSKPQKRRRKKKHWKIASIDHEDYHHFVHSWAEPFDLLNDFKRETKTKSLLVKVL